MTDGAGHPHPSGPARRALTALVEWPLRAATSTVPVPGGSLAVTADYPGSYEHNKALITRPAAPAEVLAAVERASAAAGLEHVRVDVLPSADGAPLADLASASGYAVSRNVVMVFPAGLVPRPRPGQAVARELAWEQLRSSVRASWEQDLPGTPAAVLDQLADRRHATARAVEVHHLAADWQGWPAARADLYLGCDADGVLAQVESVVTDPPARGHGLAGAVVTTAVRLALDSGATQVFLVADADDWPREFYARLGFVQVAATTALTRAPQS